MLGVSAAWDGAADGVEAAWEGAAAEETAVEEAGVASAEVCAPAEVDGAVEICRTETGKAKASPTRAKISRSVLVVEAMVGRSGAAWQGKAAKFKITR